MAEHRARLRAQEHEPGGVALLRHDARCAGHLAFGDQEPRLRLRVLLGDVGDERADRQDRGGRCEAGDVSAHVDRRNLVGIERIFHNAVEAEQFGKPRPVDRKARRAERRRAERRQVEPRVGLPHALGRARECRCIAEQIVAERDRLRLHAPGIGRDDRVGMFLRHREQHRARVVELAEWRSACRRASRAAARLRRCPAGCARNAGASRPARRP